VISPILSIVVKVASILFFIFIINMVRIKKLELKYALTWILTSISFVVMALFPETLYFIAGLMGVELPVNALFMSVIFLLIMIVFTLSLAVSRQALRIKTLVQEIGLIREELARRSDGHEQE